MKGYAHHAGPRKSVPGTPQHTDAAGGANRGNQRTPQAQQCGPVDAQIGLGQQEESGKNNEAEGGGGRHASGIRYVVEDVGDTQKFVDSKVGAEHIFNKRRYRQSHRDRGADPGEPRPVPYNAQQSHPGEDKTERRVALHRCKTGCNLNQKRGVNGPPREHE